MKDHKSTPRFIVGIDLGTTNCSLAYLDTQNETNEIKQFDIPQIVAPGEVGRKRLLPSFIYLPTEQEKEGGGLTMPWDPFGDRVVGEYARARGAEVHGRLVVSAKSWLCHSGVDRTAPLLPLDAPEEVQRLSPIVATATYLRHIKAAWNHSVGKETGERLENQDIFITIPASFDAVARDLTVKAASSAGLENITLLEEPQAAFYAWLHWHNKDWKELVAPGDLLLVCDVGGGTTDFSLIQVSSQDGQLALERIAVGEHILLGGDNMDLALTFALREDLKSRGINLEEAQVQILWHNVRIAKEKLLADESLDSVPVVIPGRGSGLVGGTIRTSLTRQQVEELLLKGFLPICERDSWPHSAARIGLQEMGLPYATDSAITRHLAKFLTRHMEEMDKGMVPSAILFNGGVFKASILRRRMLATIGGWLPEDAVPPKELTGIDLDLAVSRGAVHFGMACRGDGIRIRSGTERSYYIGIEGARPAVPGMPIPVKALCVVPKGMEEGSSVNLPGMTLGLVVGQKVQFKFMGSTVRPQDKPGVMITDWEDSIEPMSSIQTEMTAPELEPGTVIPVEVEARVTEIGTLSLSLVSREKGLKFDLEFNVRD